MNRLAQRTNELYIKHVCRYMKFGVIDKADAADILDLIEGELCKEYGDKNIDVIAECADCMRKLDQIVKAGKLFAKKI